MSNVYIPHIPVVPTFPPDHRDLDAQHRKVFARRMLRLSHILSRRLVERAGASRLATPLPPSAS